VNVKLSKRSARAWLAGAMTVAFAATLTGAPLPKRWANWRYSRVIELPPTVTARLAGLVLPQDVYLHAQGSLTDLRIIDDSGNQVPYALYQREGSTASKALPTEMLENSFSRGSYTQLTLSMGKAPPFHDAVEVHTAEPDFIEWVSVEASDDSQQWRSVAEREPIFRFRQQNREGTQIVRYSPNNARYLRVRVLDGDKKFPIDSAQVFSDTVEQPERIFLDENIVDDPAAGTGQNSWRADLGAAALGVQEVRFAVNPAEFDRAVRVQVSNSGATWRQVASGEIYRFENEGASEEHLHVDVPGGATGRYWRITVVNGSDAPLPGVVPSLYATPGHIVFEQQPGRSYRLIYGQSRAAAPQYDLAQRISKDQEDSAEAGQLGEESENSSYTDPQLWIVRNQYLIWIAAGIALILVAYPGIRVLRKTGPAR
jgi:Protein of unknown function (DUF3999)